MFESRVSGHLIRHYGLLAHGPRATDIDHIRSLIGAATGQPAAPANNDDQPAEPSASVQSPCPCCGGRMRITEVFARGRAPRPLVGARLWIDTS